MAGKHRASVDNHVLGGTSAPAAIGILSTLHANTVVTGIKLGIHDKHVLARLHIDGITILGKRRITRQDIVDNQVLAHQRMDVPCRRILENHVLQIHILAILKTDHHRTKERLHLFPLLGDELTLGNIEIGQLGSLGIGLGGIPEVGTLENTAVLCHLLPLTVGHLLLLQRAPPASVSIDNATPRDSNVLGTEGRKRRLATMGVQSLERCLDDGIERKVGREKNDGPLLHIQVDIAFQYDGPREPYTLGNRQPSPTLPAQLVDGLCESLGAQLLPIAHGPEVLQVHLVLGECRRGEGLHLERQVVEIFFILILGLGTYGKREC